MSVINATPLLAAAGGDYQISRSVRLRSSASAYLNRTFSSGANETTSTLSLWVKRGKIGAQQTLMGVAGGGSNEADLFFDGGDTLTFASWNGGSRPLGIITTSAVYRDPSAWYHIVFVVNTTTATANDRLVLYVNGVRQALSVNTQPSQNAVWYWNGAYAHRLGAYANTLGVYLDGYLTEINFIDGQALTPSSFGETDSITGVWKPKKYAGTYGTNGFYLNFSDNSAATAAAIGKDSSGNGNNWTPNNISVTAGVTYDSMLDVPTLYADGGNGRGNYAVLNPLKTTTAPTQGNLALLGTSGSFVDSVYGSIGVTGSGKYYFEVNGGYIVGVNFIDANPATNQTNGRVVYNGASGQIFDGASAIQTGLATVISTDVVGVALNLDAGTLAFYKNNVQVGTNVTINASNTWWPFLQNANTYTSFANFGQRPFAYTPPTGFKALNTQNLPEPTIKKGNQFFDATLWTGNGTSQSIVNNGGFAPDLVWFKSRSSGALWNVLCDTSRGATKELYSNSTSAETTDVTDLTAFNSNGFSVGSGNGANQNSGTYVAWQWKESPSAGFDIVTYTGTGVAQNISHSLGVAPSMIIVKQRNSANDWAVKHASLSSNDSSLLLNGTGGQATYSPSVWNNTAPTASVFSVGTNTATNANGATYVAYLFSEVAGFSRFGSYTGNGSADGPFVFCGFRPRFVMIKRTDAVEGWYIYDTARDTFNVLQNELRADSSAAESVFASRDFLSNGFKVRTANGSVNASGGTYIFMAFAESPFKNSLAR